QDLLVGLEAECLLVLDRQVAVDQHRFAGDRVERLVRVPVVDAVAGEQQQDEEAGIDSAPALRRLPLARTERIASHCGSPDVPRGRARPGTRAAHWWYPRWPARARPRGSAPANWPTNRRGSRGRGSPG